MDAVFRAIARGRASPEEFEQQLRKLKEIGKFDPFARNKSGEGLIEAALGAGSEFGIIKSLVSFGCDINAKDNQNGWTPLIQAVASSYRKDSLKQLLSLGADPSICSDPLGYSALHWGAKANNPDAIELLLASNIPIDQRAAHSAETALHVACESGSVEAAEILISQGADLNLQNRVGESPLLVAIRQELSNIVQLMLATKTVNIRMSVDLQGNTPLHLARLKEKDKLAQLLTEYGFSSTVKNRAGQTPLDILTLSLEAKKLQGDLKTQSREEKQTRKQRERDSTMQNTEVTKFLNKNGLSDVAPILFARKIIYLDDYFLTLDDVILKKVGLSADQRHRLLEALRWREQDLAEQVERENRKQLEAAMMRRRWRQCIGTLLIAGVLAVALILFQLISLIFRHKQQQPLTSRRFEFQSPSSSSPGEL